VLARFARSSYRHRRLVVLAWIMALVVVSVSASSAGSAFKQDFHLSGSDSQAAIDLLQTRFPARSGGEGDIVFTSRSGINDPFTRQRMTVLFGRIDEVPGVRAVRSPYDPGGQRQISPKAPVAYAEVQFSAQSQDVKKSTVDKLKSLVASARAGGLQVEASGQIFSSRRPPGGTELVGILAAVVILLIAFGSLLAMGLPILTALFGIGLGFAVVGLLTHLVSVPQFATQLAAMIGIGVGIDYALFIVTRYRQALNDAAEPEAAVVTAIDTAGRAVVFAGTTVVISLLGMVLIGLSFVSGLGIAAASVVAITMLASISLLPAVLGFVGRHVDKLKIPGVATHKDHRATTGYRWSRFLQAHPWPFAGLGLLLLVGLAIPVVSIRLGSSDASNAPRTETTRRAYDLKAQGFGAGASGPLTVVAEVRGAGDQAVLQRLANDLRGTAGVAQVSPPVPNTKGDAAVISVIPTTSSQDQATVDLIGKIRHQVVPRAVGGAGTVVHVGGVTAIFDDVATKLQSRLPLFIGTVLGLSFLLLLVVFRSIVVPIKAVVMNMLSIGAAYGVLVAVFQWGWGKDLIGVGRTGPIESFLPMMLFAILFGLSMDYEVFLLSRIKEEYDHSGDNAGAVADGLAVTARVITAAAAIMVCVFGSFVFGDERVIKEFGLGLAFAVLIDATVVRMVLVPATMELLGDANWWFPRWLSWLPKVHVEGHPPAASGTSIASDGPTADAEEPAAAARQPEPVG